MKQITLFFEIFYNVFKINVSFRHNLSMKSKFMMNNYICISNENNSA